MAASDNISQKVTEAFEESIRGDQAEHDPEDEALDLRSTAPILAEKNASQGTGVEKRKRKALEDEEDEYEKQEEEMEKAWEIQLDGLQMSRRG